MLDLLLVEDNDRLRQALKTGLEATSRVKVRYGCASGEEALEYCVDAFNKLEVHPDGGITSLNVCLMDVQLMGEMNGIQAAVAIR